MANSYAAMRNPFRFVGSGLPVTFLSNGVIAVAGLFSGIIQARTLSPVSRGELAAAVLWPAVLAFVCEFGLGFAFSYLLSRDASRIDALWTLGWIVSLGLGTPLVVAAELIVVPDLALSSAARLALGMTLLGVPFSTSSLYLSYLLLGSGNLNLFNLVRAFPGVLYVVAVAGIAFTGRAGVVPYASAWMVAQLGSWAMAVVVVVARLRPRWMSDVLLWRFAFSYGSKSFLGGLSWQINLRLDQLMMTAFGITAALGLYVVAVALASATGPLFTALSAVVLDRTRGHEGQAGGRVVIDVVHLAALLGFPACMGLAFLAPRIVPAVFGASYASATAAAQILLVAAVFQGANAVAANGLRGLGFPGRAAVAEGFGCVATVVLLTSLLPRFGIIGAAAASLGAYAVVTTALLILLCRATDLPFRSLFAIHLSWILARQAPLARSAHS